MKEKCKYIKAEGYDAVCDKNSVILGDIMGYDGQRCEKCEFYQSINDKPGREEKKKRGT